MTRISAVPAGMRRIVYLPSGPVEPTRLVPTTMTRVSWSGELDPCAVTVPVRVPPCAAAAVANIVRSAVVAAPVTSPLGLRNRIVRASLMVSDGGGTGGMKQYVEPLG